MDNLIMIQAGDFIDKQFGATLGISTLAAAAMGQVFSDVSGVLFGGTVEAFAVKMGFEVSKKEGGGWIKSHFKTTTSTSSILTRYHIITPLKR